MASSSDLRSVLYSTRTKIALVEHLIGEEIAAAESCNRVIPHSFIQKMLDDTTKMKPYRTSMKIDYEEHRPLEIEAIIGNPLRTAQQAGANLPKIAMLYKQLKFLDAQNRICEPDPALSQSD